MEETLISGKIYLYYFLFAMLRLLRVFVYLKLRRVSIQCRSQQKLR